MLEDLGRNELLQMVQDREAQISARDAQIQEQSARIQELHRKTEELARQVAWFQRQLFGAKTERRILQGTDVRQLFLGESMLDVPLDPPAPETTVKTYERSHRRQPVELVDEDSRLRFGPGVPIQVVEVPNPELQRLRPDEYEVVDERHTYRLAQLPGSYVVLDYVRRVAKINAATPDDDSVSSIEAPGPVAVDAGMAVEPLEGSVPAAEGPATPGGPAVGGPVAEALESCPRTPGEHRALSGPRSGRLCCPPTPPAIFERSFADVSFLAGMAVDKFRYHLPLYRQHQRLEQSGIHIERVTLTRLVHRTGELLEPIHTAVLSSVLLGPVLTVDESPTKAGRANGKMQKGYFWGFYGAEDEVAFVFAPTRSGAVVREVLRDYQGKLLTDGYEVYRSFAATRPGQIVLHQCWAHTRRMFLEAEGVAPEQVNRVIAWIQELYAVEKLGRGGPKRLLALRQRVSKPTMDKLFELLETELRESALLPSNPFLKAANYAMQRKDELTACLDDPAVPLDTNHLERELRPHAVGRKNWMFHVTEVGARTAGIFYTLIRSCVLAQVDPMVYLVDVLQRVQDHPALDVHLLTPRLWKENFAQAPLVSDLRP